MKAEIIAVGTEILLGEIVNTNAQIVAQLLARLGITAQYQTVVGDNPQRLTEVITTAEQRSQVIFLIGGLGPTPDDLTKQTLATHLQIKLAQDPQAVAKLVAWHQQKQQPMPANNLAQAEYLAGGEPLTNEIGLAVGSYLKTEAHAYFILPGPPREFGPMLRQQVQPRLSQLLGRQQVIVSEMARFFGIGESLMAEQLHDLIATQTNPTLATYLKHFEVGVRITAAADSQAAAEKLIAPVLQEVKRRLAPYYVGLGEERTLPEEVLTLLRRRQATVTAAESLTGGAFQALLTGLAGASNVFPGGWVTYANQVKAQLLGIDPQLIATAGVVSAPVAQAMAERARQLLDTDFALGFTGVAGPDSLEGQPVGTTFIGLAQRDQPTQVIECHFAGVRNEIRQRAALSGFKLLYDRLQQ